MPTRRSLYGLDGVNFFVAAIQTGFGVFVTVHLVSQHWPVQAIGLALTIGTLSSLVSQMPAGAFIDSLTDKRRAVRLGVVGIGLAALMLALSSARPVVFCAQALQGVSSSLIGPGIASISMALVGRAGFSERIGRNARFASIGNGLTAGVMGFAGSFFLPEAVFLVAAALTVPALLALHLIERHAPGYLDDANAIADGGEPPAVKPSWAGIRALFLDRRLAVFAGSIVLFFAASAAMLQGVTGQASQRHPELATLVVAATILLPQVIVALLAPWAGRSADRSGRRPLLLLCWALVPVQGVLYATAPGPYTLVLGQLLNGVSSAIFGVTMTLVAADLTRGKGQFNLALGALGVAIAVGASCSTLFAGLVAAWFGATVTYLGLTLTGIAGLLLLWAAMPETRAVAVEEAVE
ncbi:MAG: MFS transporter [Acetobacteraceae bacterium]|nr:MFS transporter [Pseudomonadota bacterium]